jgi:hypothetical protein
MNGLIETAVGRSAARLALHVDAALDGGRGGRPAAGQKPTVAVRSIRRGKSR